MGRKKREMTTEIQFVTNTCIEDRFFFTPSEEVNRILLAALAYASAKHQVKIFAFVFMCNHFQLLLQTPNKNLNAFMRDFQGAVTRGLNRYYGRKGRMFTRRYHNAVVKPDALEHYYCSINNHAVRSDLVVRAEDWPGVSSARAWRTGETLVGRRVNRTKYYNLCRKDPDTPIEAAIEEYELELAIPEQWADQAPEDVRARITAMIDEEAEKLQAKRALDGKSVLGAEKVMTRFWREFPEEPEQTTRPVLCATFSPEARHEHLEHHRRMTQAYKRAMRRLRAGKKRPGFPVGTFPPGWSRCVRPGDRWAAAPPPATNAAEEQARTKEAGEPLAA